MIYNNYNNSKIFNNLDRSAVNIRQFFLQFDQSSIIIITRFSRVSQNHRVHVQKLLGVKESLEILSNMSGRKDIIKGISFAI